MVVAYRMGGASYWLASRLVKTPYISIPNLIAGEPLVPELIQDAASVSNLIEHTDKLLFDQARREGLIARFNQLHQSLGQGASDTAARVLAELLMAKLDRADDVKARDPGPSQP
jgi:Lipid A disaccharide synthetase